MEDASEAASGENIPPTETDSPSKSKAQTRRAPNRQKFEEELSEIKVEIEAKEQLLQNITGKDNPQTRLQQLRDHRDAANQRRRNISSQLEALTQQINCKRDATSQLRSKLQYQTEAQVEEVIRRLETQLQHHKFRLAEERRLVAEIDKLRRSKKTVKQYIESRDELNKLRDSQQQLRGERDSISKDLLELRSEEDSIHTEIRKNRDVADTLKKELDELHEHKRTRIAEFKSEQASYAQYREQRRSDLTRQKMQEKVTQVRTENKEPLVHLIIEPYLEERQLCCTLLSFLAKLDTPAVTPMTPVTPVSCVSSIASTPMSPDDAKSRVPGFFEDSLDTLFAGVPRKPSRKVKRSLSRASMNKKRLVPLTPDLLAQFASLHITAPTSVAEVPATTEALKAKQKLLACMAAAELRNNEVLDDNKVAVIDKNESSSLNATDIKTSEICVDGRPNTLNLSSEPPYSSDLMLEVPQRNKPPHSLSLQLSSDIGITSQVDVSPSLQDQTSLLNGMLDAKNL